LLAGAGTISERHARSRATQVQILDIIAEPSAFGTEEQVLELLDELAVSGAPYGDAAWGISTSWRGGWRNTLFSEGG